MFICNLTPKTTIITMWPGGKLNFQPILQARFWTLIIASVLLILPSTIADGLQQKNLNCPEHFPCMSLQRNNDHLQNLKINSTLPNWYELCNCDQNCHIFGDCCQDAPTVDKLDLDDWTFVRVRFSSKINFITLMKTRCPKDWNLNEFVRIQCELSNLDPIYNYMLPEIEQYLLLDSEEEFKNWHVTSQKTLITYRNIYCSICNNDTQTDAWNQRLMCQEDGGRCTAIYHQVAPEILGKEKLKRTPLQNKVTTGCNLGWYKMNYAVEPARVLEILKKCLIFYAPVVVRDPKSKKFVVFKNRYCAECHNFDESMFECASAAVDQSTQVPSSFNSISTFDTNYTDGSIIDVGKDEKRCPPGTVFNPMNGFCQEVFEEVVKGLQRFFNHSNHLAVYSTRVFMIILPIGLLISRFSQLN